MIWWCRWLVLVSLPFATVTPSVFQLFSQIGNKKRPLKKLKQRYRLPVTFYKRSLSVSSWVLNVIERIWQKIDVDSFESLFREKLFSPRALFGIPLLATQWAQCLQNERHFSQNQKLQIFRKVRNIWLSRLPLNFLPILVRKTRLFFWQCIFHLFPTTKVSILGQIKKGPNLPYCLIPKLSPTLFELNFQHTKDICKICKSYLPFIKCKT